MTQRTASLPAAADDALAVLKDTFIVMTTPRSADNVLRAVAKSPRGTTRKAKKSSAPESEPCVIPKEEARVMRHYTQLLSCLRAEWSAAQATIAHLAGSTKRARCATATAMAMTTTTPLCEDVDWLEGVVVDLDTLHTCDDGSAGDALEDFMQTVLARSAVLRKRSFTSAERESHEGSVTPSMTAVAWPRTLLIVVLQDLDFPFFADPNAVSLGVLRDAPPLPRGACPPPRRYPFPPSTPLSSRAVSAFCVPTTATDAVPVIPTMVISSAFLLHTLFFQSWCDPVDFLYRSTRVAWPRTSPPLRRIQVVLPNAVHAKDMALTSPSRVPLDVWTCAAPANGTAVDDDEDTDDLLGAILRRQLVLGELATPPSRSQAATPQCFTEFISTFSATQPAEIELLKSILLCPTEGKNTPQTATPMGGSRRKRSREWEASEHSEEIALCEETNTNDNDDDSEFVDRPQCDDEDMPDIFSDQTAGDGVQGMGRSGSSYALTPHTQLPIPLLVCEGTPHRHRAGADGGRVQACTVTDDVLSQYLRCADSLPSDPASNDNGVLSAHAVTDVVGGGSWTAEELATLRLEVDWHAVRQHGWQLQLQPRPGVNSTGLSLTRRARALDKAMRVMDAVHVRHTCHRFGVLMSTEAAEASPCASTPSTGDSVWMWMERALARAVLPAGSSPEASAYSSRCDKEEEKDLSPSLQLRMLRRVDASLAALPTTAAAHVLLEDVFRHMPDARAASAFTEPAWQRAALQAPSLPLEAFHTPSDNHSHTHTRTAHDPVREEQVAELSDWFLAAATLPALRAPHDGLAGAPQATTVITSVKNHETTRPDASGAGSGASTAGHAFVSRPYNRVWRFFDHALLAWLGAADDDGKKASNKADNVEEEHRLEVIDDADEDEDVCETRSDTSHLSFSAPSIEPWREAVWLSVQAHKHEVRSILEMFSPNTATPTAAAAASPDSSSSLRAPSSMSTAPAARLDLLHHFWEEVASEVRDVMLSRSSASTTFSSRGCESDLEDSWAHVRAPLHTPPPSIRTVQEDKVTGVVAEEEAEPTETSRAHADDSVPRASYSPTVSHSAARAEVPFTGRDALCLYMQGRPAFTKSADLRAANLSAQPHLDAGIDDDDDDEAQELMPWVRHLLFLLVHGQSDPLPYVSPDALEVADFDDATSVPPPPPQNDTGAATIETTTYSPLTLRFEQLMAVQVASEAHGDALDQVVSAAYVAYAERWKAALTYLEAAVLASA